MKMINIGTQKILIALGILAVLPLAVAAGDTKTGTIEITSPWSRATPQGAPVGGAYLTITNNGTTSDRLLGGTSDIAKVIQVHSMTMTNGVMRMRKLKDGLEIKPQSSVALKPGGHHLMIIGITKPIIKGQPFTAKLKFETAGDLMVTFQVEAIGAMNSGKTMKMDGAKKMMMHKKGDHGGSGTHTQ